MAMRLNLLLLMIVSFLPVPAGSERATAAERLLLQPGEARLPRAGRVTPYPQGVTSLSANPFAFPRPGTYSASSTEVRPQQVGRGVDGPVYGVASGPPRPSA
jgi:hypothetical protein